MKQPWNKAWIGGGIIALSAIGLMVGVGYAAFSDANVTPGNGKVDVNADDVVNYGKKVTAKAVDNSLFFGGPSTRPETVQNQYGKGTLAWQPSEELSEDFGLEDLDATFNFHAEDIPGTPSGSYADDNVAYAATVRAEPKPGEHRLDLTAYDYQTGETINAVSLRKNETDPSRLALAQAIIDYNLFGVKSDLLYEGGKYDTVNAAPSVISPYYQILYKQSIRYYQRFSILEPVNKTPSTQLDEETAYSNDFTPADGQTLDDNLRQALVKNPLVTGGTDFTFSFRWGSLFGNENPFDYWKTQNVFDLEAYGTYLQNAYDTLSASRLVVAISPLMR